MKRTIHKVGSLLIILFLAGCVSSIAPAPNPDLAPKVTKLTKAVESKVHYHQDCTAKMTEKELLYYSIAHDPALLDPFSSMTIRIDQQNKHAIILICTVDGKAMFEDAGCTSELDWAWQNGAPARSCYFTLKLCE